MLLLRNPVQPYDWGPIDGIARLVGTEPTGGHEAELWVGTHPRGPSMVVSDDGEHTLASVLGSELGFLLKVLAIGQSLSVQAHPSATQAEAGFDREEAAGLPIDAPERNYRDRGAKPEMLVALEPTWVLCGFRDPDDASALVASLHIPALEPLVATLDGGDLGGALAWLLRLDAESRSVVAAAVGEVAVATDDASPRTWVARLASQHPGDPTCLAPMLLHLLRLEPGEAIHLPAGNLHAYLEGSGVELMAASDNVLRGGLTSKHVDVDELLDVLCTEPGVPARPVGRPSGPGRTVYDAGEDGFALVRVDPADGPVTVEPTAPSLMLAVGGEVDLAGPDGGLVVGHGDAAHVAAGEGPLVVSGTGTLWWATTRAGLPA